MREHAVGREPDIGHSPFHSKSDTLLVVLPADLAGFAHDSRATRIPR